MTDKQIMIDGVDVSGCKYFNSHCKECKAEYYTRYGYEIVKFNSCKDNPNCYFKQLKRSEAQCEDMFVKHTDLEMKYKQKEQECERLEDKLKKIAEFRHSYCMDCEDLLKPSYSCKGCNMVALKRIIEGK